jgi:plasmid stabilization system protein ParE
MKHTVRIGDLAERQFDHALAWYADQAPEQVGRLISSFEASRKRVASAPFLFKEAEPGLRRVALKIFPYHLWFFVDDAEVIIVAMTHFRQDTSYLARQE